MFLRSYKRRKNGKWHEYFSVVENRRVAGGKRVQRTVLYLGEISGSQEDAWRKTLQVFDQDAGKTFTKSLFADDAEITNHAIDSIKVRLSQMQLCRPRSFGDCWLGCELWRWLGGPAPPGMARPRGKWPRHVAPPWQGQQGRPP